MATVGQVYYNVLDTNSGEFISNGYNIFNDIVAAYPGATYFNKVGIQAPPGTQVLLNNKAIMIGRTGIYELDEDITITSLRFIQPKRYVEDGEAMNKALMDSTASMQQAEIVRQAEAKEFYQNARETRGKLEGLSNPPRRNAYRTEKEYMDAFWVWYKQVEPDGEDEEAHKLWYLGVPVVEDYETEDAYTTAYQSYYATYTSIYNLYYSVYDEALNEYNQSVNGIYKLDEDKPYEDLANVIVDFIYE